MNQKIDQQFISRFTEAEKLSRESKFAESLEIYHSLLNLHPNHVGVLNNIGLVHEKLGDHHKSVEFYKRCYELMPDQVVLIHNLANACTRLGKWAEALPLLEKIIDTDFDNESNSEKYALCLFNIKSKQETRDFISDALSRYPNNRRLNRLLGRSLLHMNSHVDGLKYLQKGSGIIEFDSDGVHYLGTL